MSIEKFMRKAVTPWMTAYGEHSDIVMSTRIRLARNLTGYRFPIAFTEEEAMAVDRAVTGVLLDTDAKWLFLYQDVRSSCIGTSSTC